MRTEIDEAVNFLSNMIRNKNVDSNQLTKFRESLSERFAASFTNHWFPDRPIRGNAYRCVRIVRNRMDKLVAAAGEDAGLSETVLLSAFPPELSVWIDPFEVAYRIGEEGSIGVLYSFVDKSSDDEMDNLSQMSANVSRTPSPTSTGSSPSSSPVSHHKNRSSSTLYLGHLAIDRFSPNTFNETYYNQTCCR